MQETKTVISKYGWIIGIVLFVATIVIQVIFAKVIPVFLDVFSDFVIQPNISTYYRLVSIIMVFAELIILGTIIGLFFIKTKGFQQFAKWLFVTYAVLLPVIFFGAIIAVYSNIYSMG